MLAGLADAQAASHELDLVVMALPAGTVRVPAPPGCWLELANLPLLLLGGGAPLPHVWHGGSLAVALAYDEAIAPHQSLDVYELAAHWRQAATRLTALRSSSGS